MEDHKSATKIVESLESENSKLKTRLAKLEAVREAAENLHWASPDDDTTELLIKLGQALAAAEE